MKRNRIAIFSSLIEGHKWLDDRRSYEDHFASLSRGFKKGFQRLNGTSGIDTYAIIRKKVSDIGKLVRIDTSRELGRVYFSNSFVTRQKKQEKYGVIIETYSPQEIDPELLGLKIRSGLSRLFLQNVPHDLEFKIVAYSGFDAEHVVRSEASDESYYFVINDMDFPGFRANYLKICKTFKGKRIELSHLTDSASSPELPIA